MRPGDDPTVGKDVYSAESWGGSSGGGESVVDDPASANYLEDQAATDGIRGNGLAAFPSGA